MTPEAKFQEGLDHFRNANYLAAIDLWQSLKESGFAHPNLEQFLRSARLERSNTGGLNEMVWGPAERAAPGPGEVEIAVAATGLNFRDVLWALSMLPEEILEDGFAGPRLGLEAQEQLMGALEEGDRRWGGGWHQHPPPSPRSSSKHSCTAPLMLEL